MRFSNLIAIWLVATSAAQAAELTANQRLIVACFQLKTEDVVAALRAGADPNARFGEGDTEGLKNWDGGTPVAASAWTPLIAVAGASRYPNRARHLSPERREKDLAEEIQERQRDILTIGFILVSHKAEIDAHDGYGGTALHHAISFQHTELAKLLLRCNAKVNTKMGVYIDGTGDVTPLHTASWSAELTKLLLQRGADRNAKDSTGRTPVDWARDSGDPAVLRQYPSR